MIIWMRTLFEVVRIAANRRESKSVEEALRIVDLRETLIEKASTF